MFFYVMSMVLVHRVVNSMTYYTLMLNVSNMEGNPFMNFFWQSLVELPGYVVGKYLSDRFGRRWTQAVLFLALILAVVVVICIVGRKYPPRTRTR
jgi:sugar phosphate permease